MKTLLILTLATFAVQQVLGATLKASTFSCDSLPYGYYADVDKNCKSFHICAPEEDEVGQVVRTAHYVFACGSQTVFSQDILACASPKGALPCSEAPEQYVISNQDFGKIPIKLPEEGQIPIEAN